MTSVAGPSLARNVGVFGWNYNRANYKYDQGLRWQRYTTGRKMACAQVGMFRQDVADLAGVSMSKLKVYGPIYGIVTTVCVTVLVEGRSGLKFPGPPVFISSIYLQCLAIGMAFIALATWLLFHASMRAQVACVQLRTRMVRLPVPTQKQLDGSRKILSTWEEQGLYDMFRVPFVMPNGANSPDGSDEEADEAPGYSKGGLPGIAKKITSKVQEKHQSGATSSNARMPGLTPGVPTWYEKELKEREENPLSSPSGTGMDGPAEPFLHFELLRDAQKEWWGCEAYMRVCFLYGMMHLIMAFSYWITLHNIAELGMVWCSNLGAAGLTAGVWIIFRLDVLPEHGGSFPWEIGGPFVTSVALGLMYAHTYTQTMIDVARGVAAGIIIMHVFLTFRLYSVAKPSNERAHHQAKESGGRLFNESGSCEAPAWLPSAFQHVMYLVAPPKTEEQLAKERTDRENNALGDDPLAKVDMTPWRFVRILLIAVEFGWLIQLGGHAVECVMGERMLTSNPGMPPWSRVGQWYGWEHGPVSSKHYAHVTPQRGHWAWQKGWGPQGQQELWASDMFGFHPEADMHWAEKEGPEPRVGVAGVGENTWAKGVVAYGQNEPKWGPEHSTDHDWLSSGGHRRLSEDVPFARPVVPLAVRLPATLEPDVLACGPSSEVAALSSAGLGAWLPSAMGGGAGEAAPIALEGLLELGFARGATWGASGLLVVTGSGQIAKCGAPAASDSSSSPCMALPVPALPAHPSAVMESADVGEMWAAVALGGGVSLMELQRSEDIPEWRQTAHLPLLADGEKIVSVSVARGRVLAVVDSGAAYHWELNAGLPVSKSPVRDMPAAGTRRSWQSACLLPNGKVLRLASTWQSAKRGVAPSLRSELLL